MKAPTAKPASRQNEFTVPAIVLSLILSVVMGAANVYLGLRAGMTVSASIPAAVISMALFQGVLRRKNILESNLVQTCASAGESLAAGIIFTIPALVLVGVWEHFNFWTTTLIALTGGLIGILFMIPMRRVFILESPELKFPEGVACAAVLTAGRDGVKAGATLVFAGVVVGAVFKFFASMLGLFKQTVEWAWFSGSRVFYLGSDLSPVLLGVGMIVGLDISFQMFLGGAIGWLILIPLLQADPTQGGALDEAWRLWESQIKYVGVGAMIVGGLVSIWNVRSGLLAAVKELGVLIQSHADPKVEVETERQLNGKTILILLVLSILMTAGVYYVSLGHDLGITVLITIIMVITAFFFTAVASYIVGLVGNSNSPVSGMTISVVLITGGLVYLFGYTGMHGIVATLCVAGIICCVASTSGDVCNDLKTGYLIGASPRYQQIMQILGVVVASFIMAPVMAVLHEGSLKNGTGGIGGRELVAPQANLFASLANGFFGNGTIPWGMVQIGFVIGIGIFALDLLLQASGSKRRLYLMPVAVGIYLPLGLSVPILLGGYLHWIIQRWAGARREFCEKRGVLLASGIIAGESLMGVAIGFLTYFNFKSMTWGETLGEGGFNLLSISVFVLLVGWALVTSLAARSHPVQTDSKPER